MDDNQGSRDQHQYIGSKFSLKVKFAFEINLSCRHGNYKIQNKTKLENSYLCYLNYFVSSINRTITKSNILI